LREKPLDIFGLELGAGGYVYHRRTGLRARSVGGRWFRGAEVAAITRDGVYLCEPDDLNGLALLANSTKDRELFGSVGNYDETHKQKG